MRNGQETCGELAGQRMTSGRWPRLRGRLCTSLLVLALLGWVEEGTGFLGPGKGPLPSSLGLLPHLLAKA